MVEELPLALEYGMSLDDFWNGDCDLIYAYQKAYINKMHNTAYVNSLYNKVAYEVCLANAFRKKGTKATKFPTEAIFNPFSQKQKQEKSYIQSIDTTNNNNGLYNLKAMIEERRKGNR